jgi:uncharacterized protein involved in response to NO
MPTPDGKTLAATAPRAGVIPMRRPLDDPSTASFSQGFRPFFLIAGLRSPLGVAVWTLRTLRSPIPWILHVASGLVVLALALKAAWLLLGSDRAVDWLPLQRAGAFATMILGVMTRATRGHTGRPLVARTATVAACGLLLAAVVLRGAGPVAEHTMLPLAGATVCWAAGFLLFLDAHGPILVGRRVCAVPG